MQKKVYVSKSQSTEYPFAPDLDRFSQIEKLNDLVTLGWKIVKLVEEEKDTYFVLEKEG